MLRLTTIFVLAISVCSFNYVDGARILGVFPTLSKSHWILGSALMKELALQGHEVTDVSPFKLSQPLANYHHVHIDTDADFFNELVDKIFLTADKNPVQKVLELYGFINTISASALNSSEVKQLINSDQQFDLMIMEIFLDHALLGFADRFNCPVVGLTTHGTTQWVNLLVGTPQPLSYVPHVFLGLTERMNFWQRLGNVLYTFMDEILLHTLVYPVQEQLYREAFPKHRRSLKEMMAHGVSLVLVNNHFSLSYSRPYVPNMVEIGGFHINRTVRPLPVNIRKFIEDSPHGVIYFSMGSNIKPSTMGTEKRDALLRAFDRVNQTIIWKWDDETLGLDRKKFLIGKWLPQDDILTHPNVKLFITHGGLLSCTESIYRGKPVIGIPIFGDQLLNMARAEQAGWGVTVAFTNITEQSISWALTDVLNNDKYTKNVQAVSRRLHDQPLPPMELAKYWVNYVLQHNGADHIKSPAQQLSLIQYHNLDVFLFIGAAVGCALLLLVKIVAGVWSCVKGSPKSQPSINRKKKVN